MCFSGLCMLPKGRHLARMRLADSRQNGLERLHLPGFVTAIVL